MVKVPKDLMEWLVEIYLLEQKENEDNLKQALWQKGIPYESDYEPEILIEQWFNVLEENQRESVINEFNQPPDERTIMHFSEL